MEKQLLLVAAALSCVTQCGFAQDLRDVIQTMRMENGGAVSITMVNRDNDAMEASVIHIDRHDRATGKLISRGVAFFDIVLDRRNRPISPGGTWSVGQFPGEDATTRLRIDHCGAIYTGGALRGRTECTDEILNRRRSVLAGTQQALSLLDLAISESWDVARLLARVSELKAPLPWQIGKGLEGSSQHSTLQRVKTELESLKGADEYQMKTQVRRLRDRLRATQSSIEQSLPKLE